VGIYQKYVLPKVVHFVCASKPSMKQREKVVPLAAGRVLEIGIGSGLNLPFYRTDKVQHIWGLDPSAEMWEIAQKSTALESLSVEFLQSGAEEIPLESNSADTVLVTYTLCTIPVVEGALSEIHRVLRPEGKLVFCEHGKAPDEHIRRWQDRVNPIWRRLGGGCNLNRDIPGLLQRGGFNISQMETMYLPGWKPATYNFWGVATH